MKKRNKFGLVAIGLIATTFALSGCTANFCTDEEKGRIAYALESGVTQYYASEEISSLDSEKIVINEQISGTNFYRVVIRTGEDKYDYANNLNNIIASAKSNGIKAPKVEYLAAIDKVVFDKVLVASSLDLTTVTDVKEIYKALNEYGGAVKFNEGKSQIFTNYKEISAEVKKADLDANHNLNVTADFEKFYLSSMSQLVDTYRSAITTNPDVKYGNYGVDRFGDPKAVSFEKTTWGQAWTKGGRLIEGLVVFPVAWMIDAFAGLFAKGYSSVQDAYLSGVPQLLSLIIVTIIVRLFIFLVTIKSTMSQRKMTELQPELAKIQQKYPNSNTSQVQKQRLAEEQMRLYKKYKINPLSQLLVLIVQFPVFIGVWGAMTGSAVLSTGKVLGLDLSQSIWEALKLGPKNHAGWWTALVLIILMSASQFFSMKIPQWIQKRKAKKVASLAKNPAQKQQNRTANIVSYVMLVMIIIMGFTLPASMGVYWFIGALVSLLQTLITTALTGNKKHKNRR